MGTYNNEIEQFIYTVCYRPMWEAAYTYIAEHPYALNLSYSRIQNPDSAMLEDMILEYTKNIRTDEDSLLFDAVVSCTINLTEDTYKGTASHETSQWLVLSCVAVVTDIGKRVKGQICKKGQKNKRTTISNDTLIVFNC